MREAIGGTWLFGLVITFIVFFASFLAVSINYSKAFHVKNNIVDLISKYEGNNDSARKKISSYLSDVGYLVSGNCKKFGESYFAYNLNDENSNNNVGYYCIAKESNVVSGITKTYYRVGIFFRIDLPIIGDITTFGIKGETEAIYYANDDMPNN